MVERHVGCETSSSKVMTYIQSARGRKGLLRRYLCSDLKGSIAPRWRAVGLTTCWVGHDSRAPQLRLTNTVDYLRYFVDYESTALLRFVPAASRMLASLFPRITLKRPFFPFLGILQMQSLYLLK